MKKTRSRPGSAARRREVMEQLFEAFGGRCFYCDVAVVKATSAGRNPPNTATRDHVVPYSAGGSGRQGNLVLSCLACNAAKAARPVSEFVSDRTAA